MNQRSHSGVLLALLLTACGGPMRYELGSTAKAPGADAVLVADIKAEQNATRLTIEIKNLAPPDRVAAGAAHYVVWQRKGAQVAWARVGGLEYDPDAREGSFEGSVPEAAFDLQVTAEKELSTASPSPDAVLSQRVQED